ncbi:MAG: hemolysin III family protein [Actinomycetota bacterium]
MTATALATCETDAALVDHPALVDRPLLRGRIHLIASMASIPAGFELVAAARPDARLAVAVCAVTWTLMFATSATYHIAARSQRARSVLRRADHSAIFLHIAGAATALLWMGLPADIAAPSIVVVWTAALLGVVDKIRHLDDRDHDVSWLYPVLGAAPMIATPGLVTTAGPSALGLMAATLALFGLGAVCFARKRPDPIPTIFGYHEVWHVFTVLAGLCQYVLVLQQATA